LFRELSFSFREDTTKIKKESEDQVNNFVENIIENVCGSCHKYTLCWDKNIVKTYHGLTNLMTLLESSENGKKTEVPEFWSSYCIHDKKVFKTLQFLYEDYSKHAFWKKRIRDSRQIVSEQLKGMADIMHKLASEIRYETQVISSHEEQIKQAIEELGLPIQSLDILNLEEGKVEIEIVIPHNDALDECKKLVAPLLTEILGEPINVFDKVLYKDLGVITLGSAQKYELKTGIAVLAKGRGGVSGDSYCHMNLGTGKYAVALSDGMGNGGRAQEESNAALRLLRRLLLAGMKEEIAVEIVNSILSMRTSEEIFATIDLALVDLNTAKAKFMKIGSIPGFIKRGKQVTMLSSSNLPIGILKEIEVEPIEMSLLPGDFIIMFTDGVYDAPKNTVNKEAFLSRLICEIDTKDPQQFADMLLERVTSYSHQIEDDMTVVVAKIEKYMPRWSTIHLPGTPKIKRRSKVVV